MSRSPPPAILGALSHSSLWRMLRFHPPREWTAPRYPRVSPAPSCPFARACVVRLLLPHQPDNLLLFESGTLRICDFGCARRIRITRRDEGQGGGAVEEEELLTDSVGTYTFHSPESLNGDGEAYSGRAADAWAAACTLYCWTFGHLPFHDDALEPLFAKIRGEEVQVGRAVSPELASLLKGMLRKDPSTRIGLRDALQHPWMEGVPEPPPPAGYKPPDAT